MQDRLNRLFGNVYLRDEDTGFRGNWVPAVDIFETEKHDLVLRAELPGMSREDIEVTVENGTIVIKGEKKFDPEVKEEHYRRIERTYGTFHRSFTLPNTVDAEKVGAEFQERRADGHAAVQGRGETAHCERRRRLVTSTRQA